MPARPPKGQLLILTNGLGRDIAMSHIAVQEALNGESASWFSPMSDDEYKKVSK